jgi:hypothetical protein
MKSIKTLRRVVSNVDQVRELAVRLAEELKESADNQSTASNLRLDRLKEATEEVTLRLIELKEALDNQSTDNNTGLNELLTAITNQTSSSNIRSDALIEAVTRQTAAVNRLLEQVVSASHSPGVVQNTDHASPETQASSPVEPMNFRAKQGIAPPKWLQAESPPPSPLPRWSGSLSNGKLGRSRPSPNALEDYQPLLDGLEPWRGEVPKGFLVDYFGTLTDANFRTLFGAEPETVGGTYTMTQMPALRGENGEWWFEAVNWIEAARAARDHFVMITLGAAYGAQAVGAHRVLQIVNPMPCKLAAVEPVAENHLWLCKHFRDNGIDPDMHWLVSAAISDLNDPVYFPVGGAGSGANNCMSTDVPSERKILVERLIEQGKATEVLRNIIMYNTTGVIKDLLPGQGVVGEIELLSAVTLRDVLSPFEHIDYLEADIQQSEARVFPPFIDLLKKKVRRIHLGTHGGETHEMLHKLFEEKGWGIVFSYPPDGEYNSEIGPFSLNDGVLTVLNPDI